MDVKYDEELVKDIQDIFIHKIVPDNFILVVHKYNRNVLTFEDIERLRKSTSLKASMEVNYELLLTMKKYSGWFEVILQVCKDPDVKQGDLAVAFETIKKELDERWTRDHTKKKEIAMGLSKLSLASESNQRTANGIFETDQGAVCMSSEGRWPGRDSNQLSKDNDREPTHMPSWVGVVRKNDKPYCTVCLTPLTSDKAADDHCRGKQHRKKLEEAGLVSHDRPRTGITMAAISPATCDGAKSEPNSGSNEPSVSSGATSDYKVAPASWTPLSYRDEGNKKELLTESQSVTASHPCRGGSSVTKATSSSSGATKATPTCSGATRATLVNPDSNHAIDGATKQASGSDKEYIVEDGNGNLKCRLCDVPVTSGVNAAQHLQGSKHKKKVEALKDRDDTPSSSVATKATPTCSGATEATLVSHDRSHAIDTGCKQASVNDEEYIVEDGIGKLKCRVCDVPFTSGDSAAQHLQGSKHKKKLEALKDQDDLNETPPELGPNGEIITYGEPTGKCYVCNIPINSRESAKQHREGRKHINRCKQFNLPVM